MTTIHVGDIDVKSERGLSCLLFANESAEINSGNLNDNTAQLEETRTKAKDKDEKVKKSQSFPQDNKPDNPEAKKSKQSFWELTKRLGQRVGTKLSLKRDSSDVRKELSSRGSVKSPANLASDVRNPATPLNDKPLLLSAESVLPPAEKIFTGDQIATNPFISDAKSQIKIENAPNEDELTNATKIESPKQETLFCTLFTNENSQVASPSFPDTENLTLPSNELTPPNENKPNTPKENQETIQAKNKSEENIVASSNAKCSTPNAKENEKVSIIIQPWLRW